ncbi:MAG: hypothetical protein JW828_03255 [Sedimentisphaerales bacterium]|nr:hypothetical protein [Sedimentisphaerales bacterium]
MDKEILHHLADLAEEYARLGLQPVICGGLGVYLCFSGSEGDAKQLIRATNDIDLMITRAQVLDRSRCRAIARIITEKLHYAVREEGKHFRFLKASGQPLDILAPPIEFLKIDGFRVKLVESKLHGHLTKEAEFIEEDLRNVVLPDVHPEEGADQSITVLVPSPVNLLILKLFAFRDRNRGDRQEDERAQAHAWDIFIITMLSELRDYREGRRFLERHKDSEIIQTVKHIVTMNFSNVDQDGWQRVLGASDFYPLLNRHDKEAKLEDASRRLMRWFG